VPEPVILRPFPDVGLVRSLHVPRSFLGRRGRQAGASLVRRRTMALSGDLDVRRVPEHRPGNAFESPLAAPSEAVYRAHTHRSALAIESRPDTTPSFPGA
jgi:hypothetical protein